jgi:subtilisin family serine protease
MKRLSILLLFAFTLSADSRTYLVEFRATEGAQSASLRRFRTDAAAIAIVRHEYSRAWPGAAVELRSGQSVESLKRLPNVAAVYPDSEVVAYAGDAAAGSTAMHVRRVSTNANGSGIVVAVLDTGIDGTHPALAGKVIGGHDFINDDSDAMDDHGHGTHVAGIIAAQSPVVTGVAPGAKLLAYKVLNADGRGTVSAVLAAIERALDPNGDGNPADHADIINLSLGDRGHPDDPMARAVDNAVALGVVVCVAAGNDGAFHRIGTPAGAANAITVGASATEGDTTVLAFFSSRGPATGTAAIKPDLIAPGRDIYSSGLNHGYITLSGTSMATPYVAGLAALLLEEHPEWTPARIKSALVTTAQPVDEEEVMAQGTGSADLARASANTLAAWPTQVSFGLDGSSAPSWTSTKRITLRNESSTQRTVNATIDGGSAAIAIAVHPAEVTLAPGASASFDVTVSVDHVALGAPKGGSFAYGGMLRLHADEEEVRLPWAFVRAARATITNDGGPTSVQWYAEQISRVSAVSIGTNGLELLCAPQTIDFVVTSREGDDLRVVALEQKQIAGDVAFHVTAADAPHEIRFAATDEKGTPLPDGDGEHTLRTLMLRLVLPNERTLPLPEIRGRVVRASSFGTRIALLGIEAFLDRDAARVYVAQHTPVRALDGNRLLQIGPGDYAKQNVTLHFPAGPRRDVAIQTRDWTRRPAEQRPAAPSLRFAAGDVAAWNATVFLSKELHENVAGGVQFSLFTEADERYAETLLTPALRRDEHGFLITWGYTDGGLPVRTVPGETLSFGRGVVHAPFPLRAGDPGFLGDAQLYGDRGDERRKEMSAGSIRILDASGKEISNTPVTPGGFLVPLPGRGVFTAEIRFPALAIEDRIGEAMLTTRFDSTNGMAWMPSITSLSVLDATGEHTTRLPLNGNGSIVFSAADYEGGAYRRVVSATTKVFFRKRHTTTWQPLTAVATGDEESEDSNDRWPSGIVYRADLHDALRSGPGEYEIAIDIADEQGNTTRWQIAPAFIVELTPPSGGKRRAVGK